MKTVPSSALWQKLTDTFDEFYQTIQQERVKPIVAPETIRNYLQGAFDFEQPGMPLEDVLGDVAGILRQWNTHVTHPRYFGLFTPNSSPASVVADSLTALYNPQLAVWTHSPAACEMERHLLRFLMGLFGLEPDFCHANFTTGGSEANYTAVITALTHEFPAFGYDGLRGLPAQPTLYLSQEAHDSFMKITHMTGLGRGAVREIPATRRLQIDLPALQAQIEADRQAGFAPFMVVATAGTTSAGAIDPLPELAKICRQQRLWLHVDAAWGGAATLSPKYGRLLAGIEQADSITCDAHKWFSVAMGAGMFFCRHPQTVAQTFRVKAVYMPEDTGHSVDNYNSSMQWSRRFIGLKLFMSLAEKGLDGYCRQVERQAEVARLFASKFTAT